MKSRFLQLHILTAYPPSNLNRDDLGRPKTAVVGGANRLRISSQCLKRSWRGSSVFISTLDNALGKRTKLMGDEVFQSLVASDIPEKDACKWAEKIIGKFGKVGADEKVEEEAPKKKRDKKALLKQLVHFSPQEEDAIWELVELVKSRKSEPTDNEVDSLPRREIKAADIALFGRMLADSPEYNIEAAAQVAHAITTHRVAVEDDFFSAVDDLNQADERGSGHLGVHEFGSGLFYLYICINREELKKNLQGDIELAKKSIEAFVEAAATVSPSGKQNSFAALSRASYVLAELGDDQPRSLSNAFFKPIEHTCDNTESESIRKLDSHRTALDRVYGSSTKAKVLNVMDPNSNTLKDIIDFSSGDE